MKFAFKVNGNLQLYRSMSKLDNIINRWQWEADIGPVARRVNEAKSAVVKATSYKNEMCYASLCGYYQAIVPILASMQPEDALKWLEEEADKLESELPFAILKHSKPEGEQK